MCYVRCWANFLMITLHEGPGRINTRSQLSHRLPVVDVPENLVVTHPMQSGVFLLPLDHEAETRFFYPQPNAQVFPIYLPDITPPLVSRYSARWRVVSSFFPPYTTSSITVSLKTYDTRNKQRYRFHPSIVAKPGWR